MPPSTSTWLALTPDPLPVAAVGEWAVVPGCGAVVTFTGTVRDHADGREGVASLTYEAYEEHALAAFQAVADAVRAAHPGVDKLAILHRTGRLELTEAAVVVGVAAPHRDEAFEAARMAIDEIKATAPIWKRETWQDGEGWGTRAQPLEGVGR